jgi:hypothetical protein
MEPSAAVRQQRQAETLSLAAGLAAGMGAIAAGNAGTRPCPYCAESIKPAAKVCRFCGRDIESLESEQVRELQEEALGREMTAVEAEFPSEYATALTRMRRLGVEPLHPGAWVRELCNRIAAGGPPDVAAQNIPLDWDGPLPLLQPEPQVPRDRSEAEQRASLPGRTRAPPPDVLRAGPRRTRKLANCAALSVRLDRGAVHPHRGRLAARSRRREDSP